MPWLQLALIVERAHGPLVEAALENTGALAVTLDDAGDDPILEPAPNTTPLWQQVRATALYDDSPAGQAQAREAASTLARFCLTEPSVTRLEDRAWERVWLDEFRPTRFGRRLWVCPRGQRPDDSDPNARDSIVVELDPGLAFGTGHHPTTALCLGWLDATPLAGLTVLDYGCGSGILAIAALKLGAARAIAIDHDPQALEATASNAAANRVAERLALCSPDTLAGDPADLVVANILAGPLVELAPRLTALTKGSGHLALSGILETQVDQVAAAYRDAIALAPTQILDGWALLHGRRAQRD